MRLLVPILLLAATPLSRAEDLRELYLETRDESDSWTNIEAATEGFPDPSSALGLALAPEVERWLATIPPDRTPPFVLAAPAARTIETAAIAVTEWQEGGWFGSDDDELDKVWPAHLSPAALLDLKLAVERGADRLTLHHIVSNDLDSEEARERFVARVHAAGARLRAQRGAPALTIVNTDVDDTVFAKLWDRGRYVRDAPYPGVRELLRAQGQFLVVLTARPSVGGAVSGRTYEKFIEFLGLRGVDPARVNVSVAPGELVSIASTLEMGLQKAETLLIQRRLFPEALSVFNGDSGQGDWIAALILRDLDPEGFPYATIHDVRPWSRRHRDALHGALLTSERLEAIYRRALRLPAGRLSEADDERLGAALAKIRADVDRALAGRRLDGAFLASRGIVLFRDHAGLALDLAAAGRISADAADRVVAAAARDLRFLPPNELGFDAAAPARLAERLAARARERLGAGAR